MARDKREDCPFETVPTKMPGVLTGVLWVHEKYLLASAAMTVGTKLGNFLPAAPHGDARAQGYNDYVFTDFGPVQEGWHAFYFARPFSTGEKTTAFRTTTVYQGGIYWPPVFAGASIYNFQAYDADGVKYTADTIWDFNIRDSYDRLTKTIVEYFASHEPHTFSTPTLMQPEGGTFYYGVGQVTLPRCLHPEILLTYSTGVNNSRYPLQSFSKTFPATNLTEWPGTETIDDAEVFDEGIYIRRKVTAYRPGNYSTGPLISSPTQASITATTATLGGNVTNDGGSTVTARGVVYCATAKNANPVIGGAGVTNATTTGTTGVFTKAITGLTTATGYSYRAYATNDRGTSYTNLDTFTTA
jgi:hypothetical protein